jgi:formyl-CoA transferase
LQVYTDRHWRRFFALCRRDDLAVDPRFCGMAERTQNITELYEFLGAIMLTRTTAEWVEILGEADIPAIQMNTPETLLDDAHMQAVGFFREEQHPSEGQIRTIGIAQTWSESTPELRYPAPRLGENSVELLGEYGFSRQEIDTIIAGGGARTVPA